MQYKDLLYTFCLLKHLFQVQVRLSSLQKQPAREGPEPHPREVRVQRLQAAKVCPRGLGFRIQGRGPQLIQHTSSRNDHCYCRYRDDFNDYYPCTL